MAISSTKLKKMVRDGKFRFFQSLANRLERHREAEGPPEKLMLELALMNAARNLAADSDFNVILPANRTPPKSKTSIRVALCGNIANNLYVLANGLRKQGYAVDVVIEDGYIDSYVMNRPFWEDLEVGCATPEEGLAFEANWTQPPHVIRVAYDPDLHRQYQGRFSAIPEVQQLYKKHFGVKLSADKALLLAQKMGHWPYLLALRQYDLVQFSGGAMALAIFIAQPFVILPTGNDLFTSPFEETVNGLLIRAAYRNAQDILTCDTSYPVYLKRLGVSRHQVAWLLIDFQRYEGLSGEAVRQEWTRRVGGSRFILMVCRQQWFWKGNDHFLRGFAKIHQDFPEWRLILCSWGPDIEQTRALISELGLEQKIGWIPLASRPMLRQFQAAADLIADHCQEYGYGASVVESMASGKPVCMRLKDHTGYMADPPPLIVFPSVEEIPQTLRQWLSDPQQIAAQGERCRQWVLKHHTNADRYMQAYVDALAIASGQPECVVESAL